MVRRLRAEWPQAAVDGEQATGNGVVPRVIATGGLSVVVAPLCTSVDVVDNDLTLHGLKLAARHVGLHW
jgi:pantothenate kinase type III